MSKYSILFLATVAFVGSTFFAQAEEAEEYVWEPDLMKDVVSIREGRKKAMEEFKKSSHVQALYFSVPIATGSYLVYKIGRKTNSPFLIGLGAGMCIIGTSFSLPTGCKAAMSYSGDKRYIHAKFSRGWPTSDKLETAVRGVFSDQKLQPTDIDQMVKDLGDDLFKLQDKLINAALSDDDVLSGVKKACDKLFGMFESEVKAFDGYKLERAWIPVFKAQFANNQAGFAERCKAAMIQNLAVKTTAPKAGEQIH